MPRMPPKRKSLTVALQNCKKSAVKVSMEKPVLLNFANLQTIRCSRLYQQLYKIVPATLQDCTNNFTRLYQQLYKFVPTTLQDCNSNFTRLYQQLYKIVATTLQVCTNNFTRLYQQL